MLGIGCLLVRSMARKDSQRFSNLKLTRYNDVAWDLKGQLGLVDDLYTLACYTCDHLITNRSINRDGSFNSRSLYTLILICGAASFSTSKRSAFVA